MQRMDNEKRALQGHPVDVHALGSPGMIARGKLTRACFQNFTDVLTRNAPHYRSPAAKTKASSVQALGTRRSNRLPPGQDTYSLQLHQTGEAYALDDEEPADLYADDEHLAAFPAAGARPAGRTMPSRDTAAGGGRRADGRRRGPATDDHRGYSREGQESRPTYRSDRREAAHPARRSERGRAEDNTATTQVGTTRKREAPRETGGATDDASTPAATVPQRNRHRLRPTGPADSQN